MRNLNLYSMPLIIASLAGILSLSSCEKDDCLRITGFNMVGTYQGTEIYLNFGLTDTVLVVNQTATFFDDGTAMIDYYDYDTVVEYTWFLNESSRKFILSNRKSSFVGGTNTFDIETWCDDEKVFNCIYCANISQPDLYKRIVTLQK